MKINSLGIMSMQMKKMEEFGFKIEKMSQKKVGFEVVLSKDERQVTLRFSKQRDVMFVRSRETNRWKQDQDGLSLQQLIGFCEDNLVEKAYA